MSEEKTIEKILVEDIVESPFQSRRHYGEAELNELARSLKEEGQINPVTVRRNGEGKFELVCGERRWRAAKIAGLKTLDAIVARLSDAEAATMLVTENFQREDLTPLELADGVAILREQGMTLEEVGKRMGGKSYQWAFRFEKIAKLPAVVRARVDNPEDALGKLDVTGLESLAKFIGVFGKNWEERIDVVEAELDGEKYLDAHMLEMEIQRRVRDLAKAEFDIEGCKGCPKRDVVMVDLFGDLEQVKNGIGHCLDGECFLRKVQDHEASKPERVRKEEEAEEQKPIAAAAEEAPAAEEEEKTETAPAAAVKTDKEKKTENKKHTTESGKKKEAKAKKERENRVAGARAGIAEACKDGTIDLAAVLMTARAACVAPAKGAKQDPLLDCVAADVDWKIIEEIAMGVWLKLETLDRLTPEERATAQDIYMWKLTKKEADHGKA